MVSKILALKVSVDNVNKLLPITIECKADGVNGVNITKNWFILLVTRKLRNGFTLLQREYFNIMTLICMQH